MSAATPIVAGQDTRAAGDGSLRRIPLDDAAVRRPSGAISMIYKEEHTFSLLPDEELSWSDERRHAHRCRVGHSCCWRRLTPRRIPLDAAAVRRPLASLLYFTLLVRGPKS
jgi:hypothetical protein